jgi:hypothetical protein
MIDIQAKDEFWTVVEECLQEFHHISAADAVQRSRDLRRRLKSPPPGLPVGLANELIYHDEPFDVACDLGGRRLDLSQHRTQYETILGRHNW